MTITLYHCAEARSLRALWALEEMGLAYDLHTLAFPPRVFDKSYKEINPLGTVPCLIDGDAKLTESAGICQYLAERYGPTPLGVRPDEPGYGDYINWLHRSDATLTFPQTLVLRYTLLEPEERRQPQVAADYRKWFLGRARSVEAWTAEHEFMAADRFTMADVAVAYAFILAKSLSIDEAFAPSTTRWFDAVTARPALARARARQEEG